LILAGLVWTPGDRVTELSRGPRGGLHDGRGAFGGEMAKKALGRMTDVGHGSEITTTTTLGNKGLPPERSEQGGVTRDVRT
jgi:hypothetical protein